LDDGDRSMGVSRVLRSTHRTRLSPSATQGVTIANGVHDIVPGLSFPVIVTNFGAREVIVRQRANVGFV